MEVYIILTETGTLLAKMIKRVTKYPLNHASISFTKELDTTYSFGRKVPNNPFIGGFVKEKLTGTLFQESNCAIYSCSVTECEYKQMLEFVQQIEKQQNNYRYNFVGLFCVLLNKELNRKRAFFCSEFVATILFKGGIQVKNKPASLTKPFDLTESENLSLIYEGQLSSYLLQQESSHMEGEKSSCGERDICLKIAKSIAS